MAVDIIARAMAANAQGGGTGTSDYNQLSNQPKINGVTLRGNKTLNDLGVQPKGNYTTIEDLEEVEDLLNREIEKKQNKLIAGENITIDSDNVISATGGSSVNQVYSGRTEPEDMNILIWIDTSDEEPITKNNLITKDGKIFMTSQNENFMIKEED